MPRKVCETFQIEYLQILDETGQVDACLEPDIPAEDLRKLYRTMLAARLLDRRMHVLQQQGRIGTFPSVQGQEGGCLGCAYALRLDDWMVPSFRETAALFWRGLPMKNILTYYMGMEEGNRFPDHMRDLPIAITVGSQPLHAVGLAWAARIRKDPVVVMVFFGDGATSEGDFHEACNMAGVFQVPVVFVCMNNQYAISTPRARQTHAQTIAQKAIAYGFPGIQVDGNDLLAAYVASRDAVARARQGQGPTFIECVTYRLSPHTTADDARRYRSDEEVREWQKRDPLVRFRKYLEKRQLWSEAWEEEITEEIRGEIDEAIRAAEAERARVEPLEMFDHVYGEPPPEVLAQREEAAEFVDQPASLRQT
ncbi:MAG: pyruvate dehydrogenase (acetyl-transferring) E1 component subunit alpha [Gemmataceae bacterium]